MHAKGEATGASSLSSQYLKSDNFIDLDYQQDTELFNSVAASSDVIASQELHMASPQYTKAYKITLEGTPYKSPYQYGSDYPNAIKTIGDLLASCQSSSVLFELASFTGGESSDLYPKSATAVIVLQENDVESFNRRFENSYEHVAEYYEDLDEPFKYTLEETKLPKRVISGSDTGNIVSLMYTITNGTYHKSDSGEIMAASNIGRISTKNKQFRMEINARSLENNLMNEMHSVFETTCGLCDIKYKEVQSTPLWYASEKLPLIEALSDGFGTSVSGTLENKEAQIFLEKNPDLNLVIWGVNLKNAEKKLSVLLTYMESFGVVENK